MMSDILVNKQTQEDFADGEIEAHGHISVHNLLTSGLEGL